MLLFLWKHQQNICCNSWDLTCGNVITDECLVGWANGYKCTSMIFFSSPLLVHIFWIFIYYLSWPLSATCSRWWTLFVWAIGRCGPFQFELSGGPFAKDHSSFDCFDFFLTFLFGFTCLEMCHILAYAVYLNATETTYFATWNVYKSASSVCPKLYIAKRERNTNSIMSDKVFPLLE